MKGVPADYARSREEASREEITRCVVAGGNGQVARMFASLLAGSGARVTSVDVDAPPAGERIPRVRYERADITAPPERVSREIGKSDLVLLAVPERAALAAVGPVARSMRRGALLVDTLSVKSRIAASVRKEAPSVEALSLDPMFHPSLGMAGRPIAVSILADGPRAQTMRRLLSSWGGRVVPIGPEEHDRLASAMQVATHGAVLAFGYALRELEADIDDLCALAPPPHLAMLAVLARIASGAPEVYWDIQSANPEAPAARAALLDGVRRLAALADGDDEDAFGASLDEVRSLLGDKRAGLADVCARMFKGMPPAPGRNGD
ncbi:prephenate dehydrogenase/arogenate dehydrogenase family protein [Rubrobacter tropicus]|uniref:Prephenate dehydrogenase/arogenate dehydrogenase family protein n=1 Tax=Rubrobacter tropicus TaxID=2653851 RepID=A0A6G8QDS5_9ACTN|nr:prephenate dehydrogenase dimerization domain-containing protein [Rubrobacter tropicus]QIN84655.1 prephenate dehydrogenase/arogenate dehydrogenase family protein [Rubrobacter tropicus]